MPYDMSLTVADFARHFGVSPAELPQRCLSLIENGDFRFRRIAGAERDGVILRVLKALRADMEVSGPARQPRWEQGWQENLDDLVAADFDLSKLVPKFVRRKELVRLDGHYIDPATETFETDYVRVLRAWLFERFFVDTPTLYEFGVGSGHNLIDAAQRFPDKTFVGLDWAVASTKILDAVRDRLGLKVSGRVFNLFEPDYAIELPEGTGVLTIGTLEQIGTGTGPFLDYLLANRPKRCVHVETTYELYGQDDLFDWLAAAYLEKRGYLRGFLPALKELEKQGRVRIIAIQRTFGSFFHDGYTYIVWEPIVD